MQATITINLDIHNLTGSATFVDRDRKYSRFGNLENIAFDASTDKNDNWICISGNLKPEVFNYIYKIIKEKAKLDGENAKREKEFEEYKNENGIKPGDILEIDGGDKK